jgi:toxin ParE1/3/4
VTLKVRVSRLATKDLDEIWLFIAQDNLAAADKFVDSLTDSFPPLASFPRLGRSREDLGPGLRSFPVKNCLVVYRLRKDSVEIARVIRAGRDVNALFK